MIRELWLRLPRLVRFMLFHFGNGLALGAAFLLVMSWFEVEWLGRLPARDRSGLATLVLFLQCVLTFAAVSMGIAALRLGED